MRKPFYGVYDQGPVVQSIVSLTSSLRRQLVKYMYMPTTLSNPLLLFFVEKIGESFATFFEQKNNSESVIFMF